MAHCEVSSRSKEGGLSRAAFAAFGVCDTSTTTDHGHSDAKPPVPGMTTITACRLISRWSGTIGVCAIVAVIRPAHADPRAVIELFTSQGCSSCPPADKILGELAKDPSVIALSMPIDYWDYLGWKDTLADSRFTARQKAYSQVRGDREVFTPQVVVNGSMHVIGSDRSGIENAIDLTKRADGVMSLPITMAMAGKQIRISVPASDKPSDATHGEVWICAVTKAVPISIGRGENGGRQATHPKRER